MRKIEKPSQKLDVSDLPPVKNYLSTGCTILDLAIADRLPGGFGVGRISHIYGPESSAKSVLLAEPLGSTQRQGGNAYLVDAESTFDLVRGEHLFGIDVENLNYISPINVEDELTIEYLFDTIISNALENCKNLSVVGIDSLSAMPSEIETDEGISEKSYGTSRAKGLSKAFRKYIWQLANKNLSLIFVDQVRQNVGVMFGKKYVVSGGEALKFYASTRILVRKESSIKNKHGKIIGINVGFIVDKNKIAPPFREGTFRLLFDYGIDDVGTNLQFVKTEKLYETPDGKTFKSLNSAIDYIEKNDLEAELIEMVVELWQEIYKRQERKRRKR